MKGFIKFRFVGTAYNGYQVQPDGIPTVQRALNVATRELFGFDCDVMGCSRTDAGVHARAFCAAISKKGQTDLPTTIAAANIPRALCQYLPDDIADVQYYSYGQNKLEQAAKQYWETIKNK